MEHDRKKVNCLEETISRNMILLMILLVKTQKEVKSMVKKACIILE